MQSITNILAGSMPEGLRAPGQVASLLPVVTKKGSVNIRGTLSGPRLEKVLKASVDIEARKAREVGAIGYIARSLVLATMPHTKPQGNEFHRRNGAFSMSMIAPQEIGLPYGAKPRLIVAFLTTHALLKREREICLGRSLASFMHDLGLQVTGGTNGTIDSLCRQMDRLFSTSVHCRWELDTNKSLSNMPIVSSSRLWWDPMRPEQKSLWKSNVILGEEFFNEAVTHPIPIDMRAVRAIKQSSLALDIYFWLTHRFSYLKNSYGREIPWALLQMQFGSGYPSTAQGLQDFRKQFIGQLQKVLIVYPSARVEVGQKGLILKPSPSHVSKVLLGE